MKHRSAARPAGRRAVALAFLLGMAVLLEPLQAWACAGCRNPTMPMNRSGAGPAAQGAITLGAGIQATAADVSHDAGCVNVDDCTEVPVQPAHTHELSIVPVELRLSASVGVARALAVETELPVRVVALGVDYRTPEGEAYVPLDADVHHRDEVLAGVGDVQLRLRHARKLGEAWLSLRLGTSLPTGRTEPDPFVLGDAGRRHQHVQFGTGTWDPMVGFDLARGFRTSEWGVYGQLQASLYENRHGFRGPVRGFAGVSGGWKAPRGLLLSLATEIAVDGPERWSGVARSDGSLGRTELLVGPQVVGTLRQTTLHASLRAVVFRHIVVGDEDPGEIRSPLVGSIGASWSF